MFRMSAFLIIILLLDLSAAAKRNRRIAGGTTIKIYTAPWQVAFCHNEEQFCGGVVYTATWIITAAHCIDALNGITENLTIIAGRARLDETNGQTRDVQMTLVHPQHEAGTLDYDIALLQLDAPLVLNDDVQPVVLPRSKPTAGTIGTVSGWGRTSTAKESNELRAVRVPVQHWLVCRAQYLVDGVPYTPRMFCAGYLRGKRSACQGDSGGPLMKGNVLLGIVSWGRQCAWALSPDVFANVFAMKQFILDHANE